MERRATAPHAPGMRLFCCLSLLVTGIVPAAAQSVEQGLLQLEWGDPRPVAQGEARPPPKFNAWLVKDDGTRLALDPAQARLAAGDLYMLANRRVAVSYAATPAQARVMASAPPRIEAIVSAESAVRTGPVTAANARVMAAAPVTGTTRWVTVMCKFADIATEQKDRQFFNDQYGTAVGQLGHYWSEVSYGKINLAGSSAQGWFTLPQPRSHYVTQENGKDKADLKKLFADCGAAADASVDFASVQGVNLMFNGELDGFAWGGGSCAPLEGRTSLCTRVTWNPPWSFNNAAPLAHEMGHGYGLPHSDNSDGDDDTYDNPWDVMSDSWSNAVRDSVYGARPKHINIFQRHRLQWVDAARQRVILPGNAATQQIDLDYAHIAGSANTQMLVLSLSAQSDPYATVVYTLEARKREGPYEGALAGNAVIIHKVERSGTAYSIDADVPPADTSNNEGSMFKVGERWSTPDGTHAVTITAQTATGFRVTVEPGVPPRVMSSPMPPRLVQSTANASSPASTQVQGVPAPADAPSAAEREACAAPRDGRVRPSGCLLR